MRESPLSSVCASVLPLKYQEAEGDRLALPPVFSASADEAPMPVIVGVPEDEVERRVQIARNAALVECEEKVRRESERANERAHAKMTEALGKFVDEREDYFRRVEGEVVQLALAIARKILQREAELDPTLLAALVRIAIERMQSGTTVRIRVATEDAESWRGYRRTKEDLTQWEIVEDTSLGEGECIVETELGTANFGFAAQLRDVEESFMQLLAQRPQEGSRDVAGA